MGDQAKADELENRLVDLAVRVIKLADVIPLIWLWKRAEDPTIERCLG